MALICAVRLLAGHQALRADRQLAEGVQNCSPARAAADQVDRLERAVANDNRASASLDEEMALFELDGRVAG